MDWSSIIQQLQNFLADLPSFSRMALAATFVLLAALLSRWQRADLEKDLFIAMLRSFLQLIFIGYALEFIFAEDNALFTSSILLIMVSIAGWTSGKRAHKVRHARWIGFISIALGTFLTVFWLLLLRVFAFVPHDIIPITGMVTGIAMTSASLVMVRFSDDLLSQRLLIESKLVLGATARQASLPHFRTALKNAMLPIIDTSKTVGLIKLPGAMTGMILAGASPLEAVKLQIIVMYMLIGATTFTSLSAAFLTYRSFFREHSLLEAADNKAV